MRTQGQPWLVNALADERDFSARDIEYVRDLGLVASDPPLRIANPIHAEVVPRELTAAAQEGLVQELAWYVPQWTGQNRPFVGASKPAISGGPRLELRSTSRRPLLATCLPAR